MRRYRIFIDSYCSRWNILKDWMIHGVFDNVFVALRNFCNSNFEIHLGINLKDIFLRL